MVSSDFAFRNIKAPLTRTTILHYQGDKPRYLKFIIPQLWVGKTETVLEYLRTKVTPRREDKWKELIGYLSKHQAEIINYNRRSLVGRVIGSDRMEKGGDLTIDRGQKKKGMSWCAHGSRSLGILKIVELNGRWNKLWGLEEPSTDI